jgi:group I intron endonuclease
MLEMTDEIIEVQEKAKLDDEKKWYLYCHTNKTNGKKYFGITCQPPNDRWRNGLGYRNSIVFWRAINKYTWDGFEHEIVLNELTEEEAKQKEVEFIALYKTNCCRYKNLEFGYNMTDGGEGSTGRKFTDETKAKLSASIKALHASENSPYTYIPYFVGEEHPMYGRKHTDEAKQKVSQANKGRFVGKKSYMYGVPKSAEIREKISKTKTGVVLSDEQKKNLRDQLKPQQPLYCIELDEYFKNSYDVERKYHISHTTVYECANNKYGRKSAGKHPVTGEKLHWKVVSIEEYCNYLMKKGEILLWQ